MADARGIGASACSAHDLVVALGVERHVAHQHLVEHDAERVDVDPLVEIAPAGDLLGRHVPERADDALGLLAARGASCSDLGDAEVGHLGDRRPCGG